MERLAKEETVTGRRKLTKVNQLCVSENKLEVHRRAIDREKK